MKEINIEVWMQVFQPLAMAAVPAGVTRPAEPLIRDDAMNDTMDLKVKKENEASFLKAIKENQGIIYKVCRSYSRNHANQEDLYQEIVFQLWKTYLSFKGDSKLTTWMHAVAVRSAILPLRRKKVKVEFHDVLPERPSEEPHEGTIDDRLFHLFHRLQIIDRAMLVLTMEGFNSMEIGAILRLSKRAVQLRMNRIRGVVKKAK